MLRWSDTINTHIHTLLLVKYDSNHGKAALVIPSLCSKVYNVICWLHALQRQRGLHYVYIIGYLNAIYESYWIQTMYYDNICWLIANIHSDHSRSCVSKAFHSFWHLYCIVCSYSKTFNLFLVLINFHIVHLFLSLDLIKNDCISYVCLTYLLSVLHWLLGPLYFGYFTDDDIGLIPVQQTFRPPDQSRLIMYWRQPYFIATIVYLTF